MRARRIELHRRVMIAAFITSSLFLVCYLIYHAQVGSVRFTRQGFVRPLYFTILITHVTLAAAVLPLAIVTLTRGLKGRYPRHRAIARWTFPIWLYVRSPACWSTSCSISRPGCSSREFVVVGRRPSGRPARHDLQTMPYPVSLQPPASNLLTPQSYTGPPEGALSCASVLSPQSCCSPRYSSPASLSRQPHRLDESTASSRTRPVSR